VFWPYIHFQVDSPLTPADLSQQLAAVTRQPALSNYWLKGKPYEGVVGEERFRLVRSIRYRDALNPVLEGQVQAWGAGSRVEVTIRPSWLSLGVLIFWTLVSGSLSLGFLISHLWTGQIDLAPLGFLIPLALFYLIFNIWFQIEAHHRRDFLLQLFHVGNYSPDSASVSQSPQDGGQRIDGDVDSQAL
jgi:hypothetical protein